MSDATMDRAAKQNVVDALTERVRAELASSNDNVATEQSAARLDQDSSYTTDDLSQSYEAGDLTGLFEGVTAHQQSELEHIQGLDFGAKDHVEPGAIVGYGGNRYVVGVVADPFEADGVSYEGISTDSPIYAAIQGLGVGDTFTWRGEEQRIELVA